MATTTTKLGLRKPDTTDLVNVLTDLNANYDLLDANPGIFVAANAAALPMLGNWQGRVAYQIDTNLYLTWTGATWTALPGQVLAATRIEVNGTSSSGLHDAGPTYQVQFTMPALGVGRWVEIEIHAYFIQYGVAPVAGSYTYAFISVNGTHHASNTTPNEALAGQQFPGPVRALINNTHIAAGVAVTAKLTVSQATTANAFMVASDATGPCTITAKVV